LGLAGIEDDSVEKIFDKFDETSKKRARIQGFADRSEVSKRKDDKFF
jgi:hypothetical protein